MQYDTTKPGPPPKPADNEKELITAEYVTVDGLRRYKAAIEKHRLIAEALEAGVPGIDPESATRAAEEVANQLERLSKTYTFDAIRAGSYDDKSDLERIIRDKRGEEPDE